MTATTAFSWRAGAALIAFCAVATGCTHPVLGRPALLGASVTSGAGTAVTAGKPFAPPDTHADPTVAAPTCGPDCVSLDAGVAFSAVVTAPHSVPLSLGDGAVFLDPVSALQDQAQAAAAWKPSVIIAVDWLFWPVHRALPTDLAPEQRAAARLASVDAALAALDRFTCPIVIGDVPKMTRAAGHLLCDEHDPGDDVRAEANRRLAAWAGARPNRFVLSVAALADAVNAGKPIEVAGFRYGDGEALRLLQRDGLHVTPEGLAVLMAAALDRLAAEGLVTDADRRHDMPEIAIAMEREAIAAQTRAQPGMFESLSLGAAFERYRDRILALDDAGAAEILERMLDRLESLDANPVGDGDALIALAFTLSSLDMTMGDYPKCRTVYERHWRALKSEALADAPHPWRFSLWLRYAKQLPKPMQQEAADALVARREACGPLPEPLATIVWKEAPWLGDARTLARCFPEIDEAYPRARTAALKAIQKARRRLVSLGLTVTEWRFAASDLRDPLTSRAAAGLPDVSATWYERARTDGLSDLVDFMDRDARLERMSQDFRELHRKVGMRASFTVGDEVFAALDAPSGSDTPDAVALDAGPRVELRLFDRGLLPPSLGFGFAEELDGAAAVIGVAGERVLTVITRASMGADGALAVTSGPASLPAAAACWKELGRVRVPSFLHGEGWGESSAPIALAPSVDLAEFTVTTTDAVRAAIRADPPMGLVASTAESSVPAVSWPASVCAIGSAERAVIRVPMGMDDATHTARWAQFEFRDQPVVLLGTFEVADGADPASGRLRLHAVIGTGSADQRRTGEVVALQGFRKGSAEELAKAIGDMASTAAEVRISWRPRG